MSAKFDALKLATRMSLDADAITHRPLQSAETTNDPLLLPTHKIEIANLSLGKNASRENMNKNMFSCLSIEETETFPSENKQMKLLMPPRQSTFWSSYGNRLRVNGTIEEMCKLWWSRLDIEIGLLRVQDFRVNTLLKAKGQTSSWVWRAWWALDDRTDMPAAPSSA